MRGELRGLPVLVGVLVVGLSLVPGQVAAGEGSPVSTNASVDAHAGYRQEYSGYTDIDRESRVQAGLSCQTRDPTATDPANATQCERGSSSQYEQPAVPVVARCSMGCEVELAIPFPYAHAEAGIGEPSAVVDCEASNFTDACESDVGHP